jgi:acyl-CoA synthetase (AMP-forming)/AMP-acid ligase II
MLSSGSTGLPKAVMLTHRNILARARGTSALCRQSANDVILNWLPFDHIGSISDWHLRCVELGCKVVYAPKEYVLGGPLRWLDLIDRHRVTHSWAPNFAYSLVNAALKSEQHREWDLSSVQMLLTAGESITRATIREFLDSLAPFGLQASAVQTAFGMAELGSGVTYHQPGAGNSLTFHHVDRNSLGGPLEPADPNASNCVSFASLGPVIPGISMRIVDDEQHVVPEATTGRVQFSGDAVSPGYYNNPEANAVFLADGWFDTGDVGFISGGELVLTGRADAGITINGANFYNNEIEAAVEQVIGVTASFTAACAVRPSDNESQKLAVFFTRPITRMLFCANSLEQSNCD